MRSGPGRVCGRSMTWAPPGTSSSLLISPERRHSLLRPDRTGPAGEFCSVLLVWVVLGLDAGARGVVDGPRGLVADVHGGLLGCDEGVMLDRSPSDQLVLVVRSIE